MDSARFSGLFFVCAISFGGRRTFGVRKRCVFAGVSWSRSVGNFGLEISRLELHDFKFLIVFNLRLVCSDLIAGFPKIFGMDFVDPFSPFRGRESGREVRGPVSPFLVARVSQILDFCRGNPEVRCSKRAFRRLWTSGLDLFDFGLIFTDPLGVFAYEFPTTNFFFRNVHFGQVFDLRFLNFSRGLSEDFLTVAGAFGRSVVPRCGAVWSGSGTGRAFSWTA